MKTTRPIAVLILCFFITIVAPVALKAAGTLTVSGTGQDLYSVFDAANNEIDFASTNNQVEVAAGTYTIRLNNTVRRASVVNDQFYDTN